jgi:hypothetical protein
MLQTPPIGPSQLLHQHFGLPNHLHAKSTQMFMMKGNASTMAVPPRFLALVHAVLLSLCFLGHKRALEQRQVQGL